MEESHRASTSPPGETNGGGAASLAAARLSFGHGASSDGIRGSGLGPAASVAGEPCRACRAAGASTSGTHGGGATGRSPPRRSSELARALAADAQVAVAIDHPRAVADDGEPGGDARPRCTCGRGWNERVRRLSETLARGLVAAAVPATRGAHDAMNEPIGIGVGTAGGGGVGDSSPGDSPTGDDDILLYDGGDGDGAREEAATAAETRGEERVPRATRVRTATTRAAPRTARRAAARAGIEPETSRHRAVDLTAWRPRRRWRRRWTSRRRRRRTRNGRDGVAKAPGPRTTTLTPPRTGGLVAGDTGKKRRESAPLTCCQVMRHRHEGSLWLVANGRVYDATLFMYDHPVGPAPMLRGSGRDNTEDMEMHSGAAQRAWRRLRIGHLVPCPAAGYGYFNPPPRESRCAIQ